MSEPQRQHPVAAITKALDVIRGNLITILILLFLGGGDEDVFLLYWIVGLIVFLFIWGGISWYRFTYQVSEGELRIEQGVLIRKKLYLTSDRIQVIDISAGVVQRLFGLVAVEIKTAGSSSKAAKISALTREEADRLKDMLRRAGDESREAGADEHADQPREIYSLGQRELLIAATTSGRMGVALSVVGAAFSQIDQLVSDEQLYRFIENNIPRSTSATLVVLSIITILAVSWGLSFLSTLIAYYDFEVEIREKELLISRGLLERTQLTIPFNRIQAVQVKEELMRQPFGYASLVIESAGYGEDKGNSTTLFPLIKRNALYTFLKDVLPEYNVAIEGENRQPPSRALRRYLLRMTWWTLPVILILWSILPYGIYAWGLLIPALLLGYQQYRDAGIRSEDHTVILSARLLSKTTAIIKKYRTQAAELKENPFQSRLELKDFTVYVASGNQGRSFAVRDLDRADAAIYWEWMRQEPSGPSSDEELENGKDGAAAMPVPED
ncbi:PH domain-containing protein [Fodinibius sediminis]|uniref:Putative membrane protein n=1 Tax=Fodinibius sediminis TaxID=1214077 RepID=A0A521BWF3_9BACT|nr:PH domain-containing protein [Fodinibius sediminis]SMO51537.1 putative membrane protein [Fodinibius sediminis]